ncbi:hypothetical protein F4778DRAFT_773890 [Xylariomycetidae sp. FL2044]|nr:hypothetical protein F4778DRAFT_773890 [Xylariomycetidae sp. FL2044]
MWSFLSALLLCLSALLPAVAAEDAATAPTCGLLCLQKEVINSDCSPTNVTCICTNQLLLAQITECVTASCTIREQLQTQKYSSVMCGVEGEDRTDLVWIIGIVFGALGVVAFGLRCLARLFGTRGWGWDDTMMTVTMCLMIPLTGISVPLSQHGLGLDMWFVSFDDITEILHLYYFDELLYITSLALTKVSILFFYLKVFPKKAFRICTWTLIGANVAYALVWDFMLIFQCSPLDGAWRSWDGEYEATCISINVIGWSAAAVNIFLDLAVIVLPLPELFRLSMSMKKKFQIMLMFTVGFFITIVSIVRLHSLIQFGTTSNLTQDYVEVGYWSTIEVPVGVICACMPAIRSLFSLAFPKMFGTTRGGTSGYYGSYGPGKLSNANKIKVKQEWMVMSGPVEPHHNHARTTSEVELVPIGSSKVLTQDGPTRKMTLRKEDGTWNGYARHHDDVEGSYFNAR